MSKLKIGMAGLLSAALGVVAQGCFTAQPAPECTVVTASSQLGVGPYYAKLEQTGTSTGTCQDNDKGAYVTSGLTSVQVGMQRFASPGDPTFTMYVRTDLVPAILGGGVYACDDDLTNNCTNTKAPGKCVACIASGKGLTAKFADGGAAATTDVDGGPIGIVYANLSDGGVSRVSLSNACKTIYEAASFADSTDENAAKVDNVNSCARFPTGNVCAFTPVSGGAQNLDIAQVGDADPASMPYTCTDGTTFSTFPLKTEFSSFEVVESPQAPATFWTANLKITEGTCVSDYAVTGFWPIVDCTLYDPNSGDPVTSDDGGVASTDEFCNPSANLDAGTLYDISLNHATGSGVSPYFKSKCDPVSRICTPTVKAAELK